ncbi:glutathione-dependent disulfide-bond oxidoreductase [Streptococcus mutans]|uniref:glutathione-dependent disulfide-bond oxidoreductase n=1 Tax=Streptococcus mutans TaxID=1309 RepID=UPI001454F14A|nr:glutathione-dependent disulfide-bond oxidoreductase [Streptococcus mutans]NLQ41513.1 glutathione-dependent disulfide-bond oxidoreductase [Streptococcus mutans]
MPYYIPPKVWSAEESNQGKFSAINRPTAGSHFDQKLPQGDKPLQVYSLGTPNGLKVAVMLEELRELGVKEADYDLFKISIMDGDQFGSDFVAINPNSKIPALLDKSNREAIRVFESGSILLYLADKFNHLIPEDWAQRTEVLNWLFWQMGAAPFVGGGFGHFFSYAPEKLEYPINRFTMETKRQLDLLNKELANKPYIAGEDYTIADIAIWSWYGRLAQDALYEGAYKFLALGTYQHLLDWTERIAQRPAVKRALEVDYKAIK